MPLCVIGDVEVLMPCAWWSCGCVARAGATTSCHHTHSGSSATSPPQWHGRGRQTALGLDGQAPCPMVSQPLVPVRRVLVVDWHNIHTTRAPHTKHTATWATNTTATSPLPTTKGTLSTTSLGNTLALLKQLFWIMAQTQVDSSFKCCPTFLTYVLGCV